ncbi:MAG: nucleotide exchange factor GrpE [Propionibacteriaceae bacterium]|nr:nucleotide exchange factor GrpE [Propionibacteriaceae bacterium]
MTDTTDDNLDEELKNLADGLLEDSAGDGIPVDIVDSSAQPESSDNEDGDLRELLKERTADLQRLQAEYVNYKRRVDRDRDLARERGIEAVMVDLLPLLDGVDAARSHGELTAGGEMLADEVAKVAAKYGLVSFGEAGEPFNPHIHEALMQIDLPDHGEPTIFEVFQKGYEVGTRMIRPARVSVAMAEPADE